MFADDYRIVKKALRPVIDCYGGMSVQALRALPGHIRRTPASVRDLGWRYLLDVGHFVRTHTIKAGKRLSFHAQEVACIKKGKMGKPHEFGRVFQLGRIGGNFLMSFACTCVRMEDKQALPAIFEQHRAVFGADTLKEAGADKGYHSACNRKAARQLGINADGLQRPRNAKKSPPPEVTEPLRRRRAGIEPLIQHAKSFGLGKSTMKSDRSTLASGYRAVMGFNLHQFMRHMSGAVAPQ